MLRLAVTKNFEIFCREKIINHMYNHENVTIFVINRYDVKWN